MFRGYSINCVEIRVVLYRKELTVLPPQHSDSLLHVSPVGLQPPMHDVSCSSVPPKISKHLSFPQHSPWLVQVVSVGKQQWSMPSKLGLQLGLSMFLPNLTCQKTSAWYQWFAEYSYQIVEVIGTAGLCVKWHNISFKATHAGNLTGQQGLERVAWHGCPGASHLGTHVWNEKSTCQISPWNPLFWNISTMHLHTFDRLWQSPQHSLSSVQNWPSFLQHTVLQLCTCSITALLSNTTLSMPFAESTHQRWTYVSKPITYSEAYLWTSTAIRYGTACITSLIAHLCACFLSYSAPKYVHTCVAATALKITGTFSSRLQATNVLIRNIVKEAERGYIGVVHLHLVQQARLLILKPIEIHWYGYIDNQTTDSVDCCFTSQHGWLRASSQDLLSTLHFGTHSWCNTNWGLSDTEPDFPIVENFVVRYAGGLVSAWQGASLDAMSEIGIPANSNRILHSNQNPYCRTAHLSCNILHPCSLEPAGIHTEYTWLRVRLANFRDTCENKLCILYSKYKTHFILSKL